MNPIPGPMLLLVPPLVAAGIAYFLRRSALLSASVSAVTTAALTVLCIRLPLDRSALLLGQEVAFGRPVVVVGRTLLLDAAGQMWLAVIFGLATLFFVLAWRIAQGRLFFPFSLIMLSIYALVTMIQPFSLAVLVLAMSTAPAIFVIQGDRPGSVRGGLRYLLVTVLAVPLLLVASWLLDQSQLNPAQAGLAQTALVLAAFGFGLLLAVFPFGTWMPALAADAPPMASAFLFTTAQAMAIFLAFGFLRQYAWPLTNNTASEVILFAGMVTSVSGGIMASAQRDLSRVLGYAALSDLGYLLLAFGIGGGQGMSLALLHAVNRSAPIALMAVALAVLRNRAGSDELSSLAGVARRLPIATLGLLVGGLALAGFPLTAGFPTHWAISRAVAGSHWPWVLLLLAASAGIVIGLLRGLSAMLGDVPREDIGRQPVLASLMIVAMSALVLVLGLYPQLFLEPIGKVLEAMAF